LGFLSQQSLSTPQRHDANPERETRINTRAYLYLLCIHPLWLYTFLSGQRDQFPPPGILCALPLQKWQLGAWLVKTVAPQSHAGQPRALASYPLIRQHTN